MRKLFNIAIILTIVSTGIVFMYIYAYGSFDKEVVLENVEEDALSNTESSISDFMKSGDNYLAAKDYENAKRRYEAAIYRNKSKEDTYLAIKDRYIKDKRFDDAYYIIQLAIENNVSVESMKNILEEIKSNFEVTIINETITENDKFYLPSEVKMKINDVNKLVDVKWKEDTKINTSISGRYSYVGYADEYGRSVQLNLTINKKYEPVKETKFGIVKGCSEKNGYLYITFDEAEFYLDDEAKKKKIEDGITNENELLYIHYYVRNISNETKEYKVDKEASLSLLRCLIDSQYKGDSNINSNVSVDQFKQYIDQCLDSKTGYDLLFWISTEDDIIVKMYMQYVS